MWLLKTACLKLLASQRKLYYDINVSLQKACLNIQAILPEKLTVENWLLFTTKYSKITNQLQVLTKLFWRVSTSVKICLGIWSLIHIKYLNRQLLSNSEINGRYLGKQPVFSLENTCVLVAQLLASHGVLQTKGGKYEYILRKHRYRKWPSSFCCFVLKEQSSLYDWFSTLRDNLRNAVFWILLLPYF